MVDLSADFDVPPLPAGSAGSADAQPDSLLDLDAMDFDLPAHACRSRRRSPARRRRLRADDDVRAAGPAVRAARRNRAGRRWPRRPRRSSTCPASTSTCRRRTAHDTALPDLGELDRLDDASDGIDDLSTADMEMETKLDLAIAYQEIGDKEGARELLDEVIKGGNTAQVGKANEMRAKLG